MTTPRMRRRPVIAVDGPVGAGKSTVARALAQRLGYRYVDTGAMYRSVAWKAGQQKVDLRDEQAVARLAEQMQIEFVPSPAGQRVLVDGTEVTEAIRSPEISDGSSIVSAYAEVRDAMVAMQRLLGRDGGIVMEGRDIGTVVFPDAEVKIYLNASLEERARRRFRELLAKGTPVTYEEVLQALQDRDQRDLTREHSPLRRAEGAMVFDSTGLTVEQVVDALLKRIEGR